MTNQGKTGLWTRDFTIITLGSVVSMVGGAMSAFAVSVMVLDYTNSTFLYALFNVCFQLPMLVAPLLAGPILDRVSRKQVIYRLDYLTSGLYLALFFLLRSGWFSYPLLLAACMVMGSIEGVYGVAYDSFYPNLISPGNYSKAYSVSSVLWPIAAMSTPIAALLYQWLGDLTPLFAFNALCFFVAASFERSIRYQETHMENASPANRKGPLAQFREDFREGLGYIRGEAGLMAITLYFIVSSFCGNGSFQLFLPYFRNHAQCFIGWPLAAVTLYSIVAAMSDVGRFIGGIIHYRVTIPTQKKFAIALMVYFTIELLYGSVLFLPVPLMVVAMLLEGILGVTSYNIRIASTQSYVPDRVRARFNGVFLMLNSAGSMLGSLVSGSLAERFPERGIILANSALCVAACLLLMVRSRDAVAAIYNQQV